MRRGGIGRKGHESGFWDRYWDGEVVVQAFARIGIQEGGEMYVLGGGK